MEKELQDYIESVKLSSLDTKETKKYMLKIKKCLKKWMASYKKELETGEVSKEQVIKEFVETFYEENVGVDNYHKQMSFSFSAYEACNEILKMGKSSKIGFNTIVNEAKRKLKENPDKPLVDTIEPKEEMIIILERAMKFISAEKKRRGMPDYKTVKSNEILQWVETFRNNLSDSLRNKMISSLQEKVGFLEEFGFLDEYIDASNENLKKSGLSEVVLEKRNPLPDVMYDENGEEISVDEHEDMGVIDHFERYNLEKLSLEELFLLELFWKSKYFNSKLETIEAVSVIDCLELWPMLADGEDSEIENFDDEKLKNALKRDIALTYLLREEKAITPEIEERYINFLKQNGIPINENTTKEIQGQKEMMTDSMNVANDVILGECVIVDRLASKGFDVKKWGIVDNKKVENSQKDDIVVLAAEISNFRGPLVFTMGKRNLDEYIKLKNKNERGKTIRIPEYKEYIDEAYSTAMASMYLPISTYFKKKIDKKYQEDPSSPLLKELAIKFAGSKKIKIKEKNKKEDLVR